MISSNNLLHKYIFLFFQMALCDQIYICVKLYQTS